MITLNSLHTTTEVIEETLVTTWEAVDGDDLVEEITSTLDGVILIIVVLN